MLTMRPSSGPSVTAGLGARIGGVGRGPCGLAIDGEAGALPLALRIGDAGQRLFQAVAGGFSHGTVASVMFSEVCYG